jgi:hypothetical protein
MWRQTRGARMRSIITVFVCVGVLLLAAGVYVWSVLPSASVSRALAAEVHRGPGTVVDFAQVAKFPWDRVFIFQPYTSQADIDACLGFHWDGARWSNIEWSDGINLVVFVRNKSVVCWFDHSRGDGDWVIPANPKGYTPQEAKFLVGLDQHEEGRLVLSQ